LYGWRRVKGVGTREGAWAKEFFIDIPKKQVFWII
jgi:hypothetical protein